MVPVMTPLNQLQFKGSHNSYQRNEDIHVQIYGDIAFPYQGGCHGLEFDFTRHTDGSGGKAASYFEVTHDQGGDGSPLAAYFGYLLSYHLLHPDHDVVFVTLCIKSQDGDVTAFPSEFNAYIGEWFLESLLFTPSMMLQDEPNLRVAAERHGWPTRESLVGKFIFCVSGTEKWKAYYADSNVFQQLCFADLDVDVAKANPDLTLFSSRVVANMFLSSGHHTIWAKTVPQLRSAGLLVRGYQLDSETVWDQALAAGVNILATDEVTGHSWAHVPTPPFSIAPPL